MALFWIGFSAIGYMGKDTIYRDYTEDVRKTPYFVLVLDGIRDGIYPWALKGAELAEQPLENPDSAQLPPVTEEPQTGAPVGTETEVQEQPTEVLPPPEPLPQPTKEFITVGDDYFDDAVFIGDSRTVGLHDYGGLDKATFFATVGLNVYDMWSQRFCEVDGEKLTLEEALSRRQYKKIYFQIGINEMGRGTVDTFMQAYEESVRKFQQLQPDAIIYVQGIMRVTKEKSDKDKIFNNPGIQVRNERIAQLADNMKIFYIDVNEVVCDDTGNLRKELTFDNLHLYGSKYYIWVDFLKTKGIAIE